MKRKRCTVDHLNFTR